MKKILAGCGAVAVVLVSAPLFAAFEAHVVNVTAKIENALNVPIKSLDFGTVFPQEKLNQTFDVRLSDSFAAEDRVDDVDYFIRQKPKCWNGDEQNPVFGRVRDVSYADGSRFGCEDPGFAALPLLCPYLSKHEITTDGISPSGENDSLGIPAFHGPTSTPAWTLEVAKTFDVEGHLAKLQQDFSDTWDIDLKVPCFGGECAQDWEDFVHEINPDADPSRYTQPTENEHKLFGCDLWIEVGGISIPGVGCNEKLDLMMVLDRSGSINSSELATLKTAAKAFVDALGPAPDGAHMGQSSFSSTSTFDLHLSDDSATIKTAIDALVSGGSTNLSAGIDTAKTELDNPGDGHDRADGESPDFMVIITDGAPNTPGTGAEAQAAAKASADAAKAAGVEIFVVGVGTTTSTADFLRDDIASGADHYFDAAEFDDLEAILGGIASCNE